MFLLNPETSEMRFETRFAFTFHNVSIKSRDDEKCYNSKHAFTFHNVSIKSTRFEDQINLSFSFTFHNVSIKSPLSSPFLIITPPDCILSTSSSISVSGFSAYVEITVKAAGVRAFQGLSTGCVFCIIRGRQR